MAKRKGPKPPHCKRVAKKGGGTRKMCFVNGKIASAAKVAAARARGK